MRILHVDHSSIVGGAERSILELARSQRLAGHDAIVAVGRAGAFTELLSEARIPVVRLGWSRRYAGAAADSKRTDAIAAVAAGLFAAIQLRQAIRRYKPDVVHAHTRKAQLVTTLACLGSDVPVLFHLRDDVPARSILRNAVGRAVRRADHAVALSVWLAEHYRARRMVPRSGQIDIVPSGVDATALRGLPTPWLDGKPIAVVGFVGQLAAWKAPHLLVEAAERLSDLPNVRYTIIGGAWFQASEGSYEQWLRQRVAASTARSRIEMPGTLSPLEAFRSIDILVHTSVEPEPFGRVIVEAMASRRPVVAFRYGAPGELLDATTGVLVDPRDGDALAAGIRIVLADRAAARARADAAADISRKFAPETVAAIMDLAYARIHP